MLTKTIWLVALATLAGCTVGPDYARPDIRAAAVYQGHGALAARADAAPVPPIDMWWEGFDDPELETIVKRVLAQNLDLAASRARVLQARATAQEASADQLPSGALDGDVTRARQSIYSPLGKLASAFPGYERKQTLEDVGAGASWELDLAGGLRRQSQASGAEYEAAQANHLGVRISLVAEAAEAYFRVRGAQARIAIARRQIVNEAGLVDLVTIRKAGGVGTARESAQARALLLQAQATIPPLQRELSTQLNRLDVLMGAAPGTYAQEVAAYTRVIHVPSINDAGGPAALLRRRPDVMAAERRLAASNARIGVAVSDYYPSVSLSGLLGFSSLNTGKILSASAFQPQATLGLHWRLFDFGRVDAEVKQARGATAEALANYRNAMLRATEDVENAIVAVVQLEKQQALLADEVQAHNEARDAAQDAYKGGAVSLIEVLDEDRQLLQSQDLLAQVQADDARSAVAAFRALGGGWNAADLAVAEF